ncbi:uncharacterized protein [Eurosta solidaginis]|uniref:uncharacterized protein n=1 Tax=Eurosta solidaginis TaxID=178769 RepID=UPI003530ABEA
MAGNYFLIALYLIITHRAISKVEAAPAPIHKQNSNLSISEDYRELRSDAQWFFHHIEFIADSLVHILPVINKEGSRALSDTTNNVTFVENTRLTLLLGLRHLLVGVKEISVAFQPHLSGDHEQQLHNVKIIIQILQDIIRLAKRWFSLLRNSLSELFRIYNQYTPEILLGKCFAKYITTAYPDRSYYEYPFILLRELLDFGIAYLQSLQIYEASTESPLPVFIPEDISDEQNEIWPTALEKYARSLDSTTDNHKILNGSEHPWQKCLKLYATDTISRQLKLFFIGD